MVAHAVDVLHRDVQPPGQTLHHLALAGALGGQLQQVDAAGHDLILGSPGLGADIAAQAVQLLRHDLKQGLADGRGRLIDGVQQRGGLVCQMKVRLGQFIGVDGENGVVIVVQLHRRLRPRVQHLRDMGPHRVRQKGCVQVFVFLEVVNGRAVEQNGGAVHGQTLPHSVEGGQRTACGDGKRAALSHEILDGFPVFRQQLRHGLQSLQSVFRVDEGVVKIAGDQYAGKLSHSTYASLPGVPPILPPPWRRPPLRRGRRWPPSPP